MFCGSRDVEREILQYMGKIERDTIEVVDVIRWSIFNTCTNTRRSIPLWATQGIRYQRHHIARSESAISTSNGLAPHVAHLLLEDEARSLENRYGSGSQPVCERVLLEHAVDDSLAIRQVEVEEIRAKCQEFELVTFESATFQEEQERELSPESEQERQVERPSAQSPYQHSIHPDVRRFMKKGSLDCNSDAFQSAFEQLGKTSAVGLLDTDLWPSHLLATADFGRTVQSPKNSQLDDFLRPVHWIASAQDGETHRCVAISPYEANELLPLVRNNKKVTLHVYSPRVTKSMRTLEDMSFCPISASSLFQPSHASVMQINFFAGQLYLESYEEYLSVCRFLGLSSCPPRDGVQIASDGFITPISRVQQDQRMVDECPFESSPVGFLRMLTVMRRKGQRFAQSHMGKILQGQLLTAEEFKD